MSTSTVPDVSAPRRVHPVPSQVALRVDPPRRAGRFALLGHAPALDGLRGFAVTVVLVFHFAGHSFLHGGSAGVDVFFCLSGFLITALILDERRVHGRLSMRRFYARRACRLLPGLFVLLGVWTLLLLAFHDQTWMGATPSGDGTGRTIDVGGALRDLGVALLYLANWNVISGGMEAPLPHLWSLAVEEQFYLVWPATLLALLLLGRRARLVVIGVLLAVSATLPWLYWDGGAGQDRVYFGTDTRAVGLLAGAFCALVWHERHARGRSARLAAPRALAGLAFVVVICLQMGTSEWKFTLLPALLGLAVSQLVPYLVDSTGPVSRAFTARWLVWAGKRSYGIYLWQYVWATWTHPLGLWPGMPLGVLGTLVSTELSWALVEAPVLRWSKRFRPGTAPVRTPRTGPVLVLDPSHAAAVAAHRTLRASATS